MAQTITTSNPSQYIQELLTKPEIGLFPQLNDALSQEYQQYNGPRVAGFSSDQLEAFDLARQSVGATDPNEQRAGQLMDLSLSELMAGGDRTQSLIDKSTGASDYITRALGNAEMMQSQGNPLLSEALDLTRQSVMGPTRENIQQYMDPFQSSVIDATMSELNRQDDIAQQGRNAAAVNAGAFGGSRQGVMEAEAGRNLADVKARTLANLNSQNFGQAMNTFQNQQQMQRAGGNQLAGMGAQDVGLRQNMLQQIMSGGTTLSDIYGGAASQQGGLTSQLAGGTGDLATKELGLGSFIREQDIKDITNLFNMGQRQQQQQQAGIDTAYQDFVNERQYEDPRARVAFMSDIIRGAPSGSQSMSRTYQDPMSPLQTMAGIAPLVAAFV